MVMVRKQDGIMRFSVDYHKTNELIKKDKFTLPKIDSCLDALNGSQFFNSCAFCWGYWQTEIEKEDVLSPVTYSACRWGNGGVTSSHDFYPLAEGNVGGSCNMRVPYRRDLPIVTVGWRLRPPDSLAEVMCDRHLRLEEQSNCRMHTATGSSPTLGLVSLLEDLIWEGRVEVVSCRHCAEHTPARHTA